MSLYRKNGVNSDVLLLIDKTNGRDDVSKGKRKVETAACRPNVRVVLPKSHKALSLGRRAEEVESERAENSNLKVRHQSTLHIQTAAFFFETDNTETLCNRQVDRQVEEVPKSSTQ